MQNFAKIFLKIIVSQLWQNYHWIIKKKKLYNNLVTHTNASNQPEDLVRLIRPTEITIDLGDFYTTFIIRSNKPIRISFEFTNIILNRNDPKEFAKFHIDEIIFEKK